MLSKKCFSWDWINLKRKDLLVKDLGILEKSIHALALLAHLSESGLPFVLKGGISLLLHLQQIRRLSIDVDIICGAAKPELDSALHSICKKAPFIGHIEDMRGNRRSPNRRHFKFFFNSNIEKKKELFILLDVIEEPDCHLPLTMKPVLAPFIEIDKETNVRIPTIEGLLADKLTAFAPNTIGVPFERQIGKYQTMQVAKQLFDIGELFGNAVNMPEVADAYLANFEKENGYRGNNHTKEVVLNDTIQVSRNFCGLMLKNFPDNEDAIKLRDGIVRLSNHLVGEIPDLNRQMKVAAAKAALLSLAIKTGRIDFSLTDLKYGKEKINEIRANDLFGEFVGLTRLKNTNPEAFYYLLKAERLK